MQHKQVEGHAILHIPANGVERVARGGPVALAPVAQPAGVGLAAEHGHPRRHAQCGLHLPRIIRRVQPHGHARWHKAQVVVGAALGKIERPCPFLFPEILEPLDVGQLIVFALVAAVLIFQLHHEDGATVPAEAGDGNLRHLFQIPRLRLHELLVAGVAQWSLGILQQIRGQTAQIPLAAHIGAGAEQHPHALLLAQVDKGSDVIAPAEIPAAIRLLQRVPEGVERNGVQPHGLRCADAVAPVLARHTLRVYLARPDLKRHSIQQKLAASRSAKTELRRLPRFRLLQILHRLHPALRAQGQQCQHAEQ